MDSETQAHRDNEIKAVEYFCKSMKCNYVKLPKYDIDFLLTRNGKGIAFAEVKCRTHTFSSFKTQMLSFIKYGEMLKVNKWLPCYFICQYSDGIYYINVNDIPLDNITKGGRNNPRAERPNDIEFLIYFNRDLMKLIK